MGCDKTRLDDLWRLRNATATALALSEEQMQRAVREASLDELVAMIETFSPARSAGPEWTRTFEPLVERLWAWCDDSTMAELADAFRKKGMPWIAVTNALSADHGARVRSDLRQPAWARLPAFTIA